MRNRRTSSFHQIIQVHLQNLKSLYLFVIVLFLMGVVFGAIIVNTMDPTQKDGLMNYLSYFFRGLKQDGIADPSIAFQHSFGDYLKTIGLLWILGLSVIGIPVIVLLLFVKGIVIGFTIGFLVNQLSWKGVWFAFLAVVPQNLLAVPALMIVGVAGIHFSLLIVRNRLIQHRGTIYPQFVSFSFIATAMALVLFFASIFEAYLSPQLMKWVLPIN